MLLKKSLSHGWMDYLAVYIGCVTHRQMDNLEVYVGYVTDMTDGWNI